jgi:DNA (cytosine-5)-methyltransferase 1
MIAFASKGGGGGAIEESGMSPTILGTRGNGGVPPAIAATLSGGGHPGSNMPGRHHEDDENLIVDSQNAAVVDEVGALGSGAAHGNRGFMVAGTLGTENTRHPGGSKSEADMLVVGSTIDDGQARPLVARASGYRMDMESETFVVGTMQQSSLAGRGTFGWDEDPQASKPVKTQEDGQMIVLSTNGTNVGVSDLPGVIGAQLGGEADYVVAGPVRASDGHHGHSSGRGDGADNLLVADPVSAHEGKTYTHEGKNNFRTHNVVPSGMGVRRLTPMECSRLQGWPDDWVRLTADGKVIPDSHQYRMIGNGVVAPVAEFIGHRLVEVDSW